MSIRPCSGDLVELQWTRRNVLVGRSKTLHGIHLAARKRNSKCRLRRYEANAWTPGVGGLKAGASDSLPEGQTVRGKLLGSAQLASGRFAMIQTPQHGVSSAADLKFLLHLQQTLLGTSNRKRH